MSIELSSVAVQGYSKSAEIGRTFDTARKRDDDKQLIDQFLSKLRANEELATDNLSTGQNTQAIVQAIAETEIAIETAVTIRNKVVEAYQEILRMPV